MVLLSFGIQTFIFGVLSQQSVCFLDTVQQKGMPGVQKIQKPYGCWLFFDANLNFCKTVQQKTMIPCRKS